MFVARTQLSHSTTVLHKIMDPLRPEISPHRPEICPPRPKTRPPWSKSAQKSALLDLLVIPQKDIMDEYKHEI